jgi:hypothetical protein
VETLAADNADVVVGGVTLGDRSLFWSRWFEGDVSPTRIVLLFLLVWFTARPDLGPEPDRAVPRVATVTQSWLYGAVFRVALECVCACVCVCVFGVVTNRTLIKDVGGQNRVRDLWR